MDATELFVPEINAIIEFAHSKGSYISNDSYLRLNETYEIFSCIKPDEDYEKNISGLKFQGDQSLLLGTMKNIGNEKRLRLSKSLNNFGKIITRKKATGIGLILQNIRTSHFSI